MVWLLVDEKGANVGGVADAVNCRSGFIGNAPGLLDGAGAVVGRPRNLGLADGMLCLTRGGRKGLVLDFSKQEQLRKTSVMALKIRLTKVGSVHQPLYRVVVAEARSRRDGDAVENLGTYTPKTKGNPINLKLDRVDYWLSKGALPTDTMHAMIKKARRAAAANETAPVAS